MIKDAMTVITPSLPKLFNLSIQEKIFPTIWKSARIIPIHKSGDKQDPSNYRPISILFHARYISVTTPTRQNEAITFKHVYLIQVRIPTS